MSFQDVNIAELKKFDCKAEICKLWIMGQLSLTTFFFFFLSTCVLELSYIHLSTYFPCLLLSYSGRIENW